MPRLIGLNIFLICEKTGYRATKEPQSNVSVGLNISPIVRRWDISLSKNNQKCQSVEPRRIFGIIGSCTSNFSSSFTNTLDFEFFQSLLVLHKKVNQPRRWKISSLNQASLQEVSSCTLNNNCGGCALLLSTKSPIPWSLQ